jgi:Ubiquitin carboxyl-terminal hydrolase, family 1
MGKRWVPLESNPDVLNVFAKSIGAPASLWSFCDVYGMDTVCSQSAACPDLQAPCLCNSASSLKCSGAMTALVNETKTELSLCGLASVSN